MTGNQFARQLVFVTVVLWAGSAHAAVFPIDLNLFFADPEVTVSLSGDSAVFFETAFAGSVLLSNDPGLGEPVVIVASPMAVLLFDFEFTEAAGENDGFFAAVLDESGFSAGIAFEFFADSTASGTVALDLNSLLTAAFLGLQFELVTLDGGPNAGQGGSTLTISNVRIDVIPLPAAVWLMLSGLFALLGFGRNSGGAGKG